MGIELKDRNGSLAFSFRGYNFANLGRTPELLAHPAYGPRVEAALRHASDVASEGLGRGVDLLERVRQQVESTPESFGEDCAMIVAMELVQLRLLEEFHGVDFEKAKLAFGYSLGEVAALIAAGVYEMDSLLRLPLAMADECVELGRDTMMGVLFSRGPELSLETVQRLCVRITHEGRGTIAMSAHLTPNTVLLLAQGRTLDRFEELMKEAFSDRVYLRRNQHRWPPLHTPLLWDRHIASRAAVLMRTTAGGFAAPKPPVISSVTGKASYNDYNSRELLIRWIEQPQKFWDVICETLAQGAELIVHVGPDPNLIPATFKRVSENVAAQLRGRSLNRLGLRAMAGMVRRPWLTRLLSSRAQLLRAPFVEHVVLEDWLLATPVE